jgi:polysaccharide biosynthesis/export protein
MEADMIKKILAFSLAFSLLMSYPSVVLAQISDIGEITNKVSDMQTKKEDDSKEPPEEAYKRFICPSCGKGFEIVIDLNDLELKKGIKKITCPYDGTEFYPKDFVEKQEELQYQTVKCPICKKEFKAYVHVNSILAGNSQVLVCPYDNKKFYFKAESFQPAGRMWASSQTLRCPHDGRTFKAYIDTKNPKEVICPYDGTKFFPTPDLIVSQTEGDAAQQLFGSYPTMRDFETKTPEEKSSRIEEMFSKSIPLNVSKDIKQFGYEIFKPVEKITAAKEGKAESEKEAGKEEGNLLKALLAPKQQGSVFTNEPEMEGGLSLFSSPTEVPTISDYILGPGDMLRISVWGQIQETFPATIDSEGKVLIPKVGPLYLWGLKFSEAEDLIKENMLKAYTNIQINVSMGRLRGIKIFVLGEAKKTGAYTISALSNAFHALYAAGGPTKLGSMRKMKLIRKDHPEMPIDLYNFLIRGDNSQDHKLRGNDTVFIPPIGDVVGIAGNVKRPAIYELKEKIKLSDLVEMAGGISSIGYLHRIQLERIQEHLRKVVLDLEFKSLANLKDSQNNLELQDGDLILVFPITPIRYNFISITGNVLRPGDYELKEGMRLKDLIDKAGGILPGTYLKRGEVARFKADQTREIIPINLTELMDGSQEANLTLKEWDVITIYSNKEIVPDLFVDIDGAVNKPGKYPFTENMKISDLIFRGGGLKRNALMSNAELFRSSTDSGAKIFNVDLNKILAKDQAGSGMSDLFLEGGDSLFIREDVSREEKIVVALTGEFKYPGKYAVEKGARLNSVIERAGGFTKNAFLDGSIFTRESVKIAQQKMIKNFLDSEQRALLQEQSSLAVGLTAAQAESRNKLIEYRQKLVQKLETVEVPGRVLIRLNPNAAKFKNSEYDIIIEDKDTLSIPTYPSTVQIVGNVYGSGTVTFSEGKGVDYYINKVGGLTKYADANRIFIIRANGETVSSFVRTVKVKRGDVIIVPEEFKYRTLPGLLIKDMVQVIYQAALGAAVTIAAVNGL